MKKAKWLKVGIVSLLCVWTLTACNQAVPQASTNQQTTSETKTTVTTPAANKAK
ncbi:hypothetical protein [Paenibacillus kyungheensis]